MKHESTYNGSGYWLGAFGAGSGPWGINTYAPPPPPSRSELQQLLWNYIIIMVLTPPPPPPFALPSCRHFIVSDKRWSLRHQLLWVFRRLAGTRARARIRSSTRHIITDWFFIRLNAFVPFLQSISHNKPYLYSRIMLVCRYLSTRIIYIFNVFMYRCLLRKLTTIYGY